MLCGICSKQLPAKANLKVPCTSCGAEFHARCIDCPPEEFTCTACDKTNDSSPSLVDVMKLLKQMNTKLTSVQTTLEQQRAVIDTLVEEVEVLKGENESLKEEIEEVKNSKMTVINIIEGLLLKSTVSLNAVVKMYLL